MVRPMVARSAGRHTAPRGGRTEIRAPPPLSRSKGRAARYARSNLPPALPPADGTGAAGVGAREADDDDDVSRHYSRGRALPPARAAGAAATPPSSSDPAGGSYAQSA